MKVLQETGWNCFKRSWKFAFSNRVVDSWNSATHYVHCASCTHSSTIKSTFKKHTIVYVNWIGIVTRELYSLKFICDSRRWYRIGLYGVTGYGDDLCLIMPAVTVRRWRSGWIRLVTVIKINDIVYVPQLLYRTAVPSAVLLPVPTTMVPTPTSVNLVFCLRA